MSSLEKTWRYWMIHLIVMSSIFLLLVITCVILLKEEVNKMPCIISRNHADDRLVTSVIAAAKNAIPPSQVEQSVGTSATINTLRSGHRRILRNAHIDQDEDEKSECSIRQIKDSFHVVYWIRPLNSQNPKCVGIAWTQDGKVYVFFGVLFPP